MDLIRELENRFPGVTADALDRLLNAHSIIDAHHRPKFGWPEPRACAVLLVLVTLCHERGFELKIFQGELRFLKRRRLSLGGGDQLN